jgi:hypothetical protein
VGGFPFQQEAEARHSLGLTLNAESDDLRSGSRLQLAIPALHIRARRVYAHQISGLQAPHAFPVVFVFNLTYTTDLVITAIGGAPGPDKLMRALAKHGQLRTVSLTSVWQVFVLENAYMN